MGTVWCLVCASLPAKPSRGIVIPFHRTAVVLQGDVLSIEYRDEGQSQRFQVTPGQVEWEKPSEGVHRTVNVGERPYEQVTFFLLDRPDAVPQPSEE